MRRALISLLSALVCQSAVAEPTDWSGPYLGAFAGFDRSIRDMSVDPAFNPRQDPDRSGWAAGVLAGFNLQSGALVYGAEIDAAWSNVEPRMTYLATSGNDAIHVYTTHFLLATARARAGFALGPFLMYGTAGVAWKYDRSKLALTNGPAPNFGPVVAFEKVYQGQVGYAAGGGLEYAATEHIVLRLEYLHYEFGDQEFNFPTADTSGAASIDTGRIALNLKF